VGAPFDWIRRGRLAERRAARFLRGLGFEILARNVRTKSGEIDLLAREGASLVVVEVKLRRGGARSAFAAVGARKKERLLRAVREARVKLRLPPGLPLRFDLVTLADSEPPRLVRGAFGASATFLA